MLVVVLGKRMHSREIIMFMIVAFDIENDNTFIGCSQKLQTTCIVISHVLFVDYLLVCSEVYL